MTQGIQCCCVVSSGQKNKVRIEGHKSRKDDSFQDGVVTPNTGTWWDRDVDVKSFARSFAIVLDGP
jgi:hypothetical protein